MTFEAHSVRLFPKGRGAHRYEVTGIAARCDWVILTDVKQPCTHLIRRTASPGTVFLSMRAPFDALSYFATEVLPRIERRFILISGSEDVTLPLQTDARWRRFTDAERAYIEKIHDHPLLSWWFVENLDSTTHSKMRPLPTGLVFPTTGDHRITAPTPPPLASRPLRVLCAHRTRQGPQWELRRHVTDLAREHWSRFMTIPDRELTEPDFLALMEQHSFVLCVGGGGLDPSPKAWQAILHGAIPIILRSPVSTAYELLPTLLVDRWIPAAINTEALTVAKNELVPHFDRPALRTKVIERLGAEYWWNRIIKMAA